MYRHYLDRLYYLLPDVVLYEYLLIFTNGRDVSRAYDTLVIDGNIYPWENHYKYVLIGDWLYMVSFGQFQTNGRYILHIKETMNLKIFNNINY